MSESPNLLALTAVSIGVLHTLTGPDHYLPFIVLARARKWSLAKTLGITLGCGVGHVLGSLVLGAVGIALGLSVSGLNWVESQRGDLAAWLLIALGAVYCAWGLHRAKGPQAMVASTESATHKASMASLTPWTLFLVFVLGPCEPLIPVLMYPAAAGRITDVALVAATFAAATLATMAFAVLLGSMGIRLIPVSAVERYSHAAAGAAIVLCGVGIRFLGL